MTTALAIRTGLPGTLRENAYILPPDLSLDEAGRVIRLLDVIVVGSPWWLVDALTFIEDKWGEEHAQILPGPDEDPLGASQARMKQAAWMGRVYPPGTRVPGASYTHHRIVAELPAEVRHRELTAVAKAAEDTANGVDGAKPISTRALIRRVEQAEEQARGRAATVDGTPIEETESLVWTPQVSDLTDEARGELERRLAGIGKAYRIGFERGFLDALLWAEVRDAFREWRD